jgi:hypothetical protein
VTHCDRGVREVRRKDKRSVWVEGRKFICGAKGKNSLRSCRFLAFLFLNNFRRVGRGRRRRRSRRGTRAGRGVRVSAVVSRRVRVMRRRMNVVRRGGGG